MGLALMLGGACGRVGFGTATEDGAAGDDDGGDAASPVGDAWSSCGRAPFVVEGGVTIGSTRPQLVWTGSKYLLVHRGDEVLLHLGGDEGLGLDAPSTALSLGGDPSHVPALAWNGNTLGVAWVDARSGTGTVYAGVYDGAGSWVAGDLVLYIANGYPQPAIAWAPTFARFVTVNQTAAERMQISLVSEAGQVTTAGTTTTMSGAASLAWTGSRLAVVWSSPAQGGTPRRLHIGFIDATGALGGDRIVMDLNAFFTDPKLVWNGTELGLIYSDCPAPGDCAALDLKFLTLDADGNTVAPSVDVWPSDGYSSGSSLVWNGTAWTLVWHDTDTAEGTDYQLFLTQIAPDLTIGAKEQLTFPPSSSSLPSHQFTGDRYAFAWLTGDQIYFATRCP